MHLERPQVFRRREQHTHTPAYIHIYTHTHTCARTRAYTQLHHPEAPPAMSLHREPAAETVGCSLSDTTKPQHGRTAQFERSSSAKGITTPLVPRKMRKGFDLRRNKPGTYLHICVHTYIHTYPYTHTYTHAYTHTYITRTYIYTYKHTNVYIHKRTYIYIYIQTHIFTYNDSSADSRPHRSKPCLPDCQLKLADSQS